MSKDAVVVDDIPVLTYLEIAAAMLEITVWTVTVIITRNVRVVFVIVVTASIRQFKKYQQYMDF